MRRRTYTFSSDGADWEGGGIGGNEYDSKKTLASSNVGPVRSELQKQSNSDHFHCDTVLTPHCTHSPGGEGDGGVNILEDERNRIALLQ